MGKIWQIALREYNAAVRSKAFIISIVLMPILMGGSILAQKLFAGQRDTTDKRIAVVDRTGQLAPVLVRAAEMRNQAEVFDESGRKVRPAYQIDVAPPAEGDPLAQQLELSDRVRAKKLHGFLEIGPDVIAPGTDANAAAIRYHSENAALDDVREWLSVVLNNHIRSLRLEEADIDSAVVERVTQYMPVEGLGLVNRQASGEIRPAEKTSRDAAILVPIMVMMLMFMMVMMGAPPLMQSVLEEKMQRIAEVLLGSVRPFELMMGKLLGSVGVSLTVVAVYVIGAAVAADRLNMTDRVPFGLLPWFFAYQVLAIFMFGAIFIAIGAACNDLKEAQSLVTPVMIVVVFPMFVWISVVREPLSKFATVLSFVPTCTPMLMLLRQSASSAVPVWQPWAGLALVVAFTMLCVWAAGRIFRVGILMQGKPPKIADMIRWAIRG